MTSAGLRRLGGLLLLWSLLDPAHAFSNVQVGDALERRVLPTRSSKSRPYLGAAGANVFVFFTPGQRHSAEALEELARVQRQLAGEDVHWALITSDRSNTEEAAAELERAGVLGALLFDRGDELYGELGTALTPVIGIADREHRLVAYLPFMKVNYGEVTKAWIRRALGKLSEEELQAVLSPPPAVRVGEAHLASRYMKMAERLLAAGDPSKALAYAHKALSYDATTASAHALIGQLLVAEGRCEEAGAAIARALELDPAEERALAAQGACSSEPVPSEPVPSEAAPSESAPSEAGPSDSGPSGTSPSDSVPSEPVPSEPVPSEPVPSEPVPSEPVPSDSVPSEPVPSGTSLSGASPSEPPPSRTSPSEPPSSGTSPGETRKRQPVPSAPGPDDPCAGSTP